MALLPRMARTTGTALSIFAAVMLLFAAVFAATGDAPTAMVFAPSGIAPAALPEGVRILRWGRNFVIVTGDRPGYLRALYASGALLVLPVRKSGCLAYRPDGNRPWRFASAPGKPWVAAT
ncbi:hypothetical protein [Rhizobium binxianense]